MSQFTFLGAILFTSKEERWSYPKTFQALVDAGVTSYKVEIDTYTSAYQGAFGTWSESAPEGFTILIINRTFDKDGLVVALKNHLAGKATYLEWLGHIAQAGIAYYVVSMADRTVTYYGIDPHNFHIEHIPQSNKSTP